MILRRLSAIAITVLLASGLSARAASWHDVRRHGAVGDGKTLDTQAIQAAVDAASSAGGGTVHFPAGTYLSGTIILKSNVTLYLSPGATLLGSQQPADYPPITPTTLPEPERNRKLALLFAEDADNITITGSGTIDGQGDADAFKITPPNYGTPPRPEIIVFISCRNVRVENVTLRDSPAWVQHYLHCDNVLIDGITVHSHVNYNNDMLDIDGCRNVRVMNVLGNTGDDGVTLKSTLGRVCENVTVTNCVLSTHANAIKLGTESTGGFRNINIGNCTIRPADVDAFHLGNRRGLGGVALEMVDGSTLENVTVSNIVVEGTVAPIFMRLGNCARKYRKDVPTPAVGTFRNVVVSNIVARGVSDTGCVIAGLPGHPVENVTLRDIDITFAGGGTNADVTREIPRRPDCYPECTMFGKLPAYGLYTRHVDGLTLDNVNLKWDQPDRRPALFCDDVRDLTVDGLRGQAIEGSTMIVLRCVDTALVTGCVAPPDVAVFLSLGPETRRVSAIGNDLTCAEMPFLLPRPPPASSLFYSDNRLAD